jgi:hypothetical protein
MHLLRSHLRRSSVKEGNAAACPGRRPQLLPAPPRSRAARTSPTSSTALTSSFVASAFAHLRTKYVLGVLLSKKSNERGAVKKVWLGIPRCCARDSQAAWWHKRCARIRDQKQIQKKETFRNRTKTSPENGRRTRCVRGGTDTRPAGSLWHGTTRVEHTSSNT